VSTKILLKPIAVRMYLKQFALLLHVNPSSSNWERKRQGCSEEIQYLSMDGLVLMRGDVKASSSATATPPPHIMKGDSTTHHEGASTTKLGMTVPESHLHV
jgi:hypothetical protein